MIKNNWKFASKNMDDYDDVEREHDELNSYLKDKIKKVVKIILEVWVYSIIGLVIGIAIKSDKLNLTNVIKSIMPNLFGLYWYTTCYLLIYIFSSNFKMIMDKTDKKRLTINIVLMLLIWSFITMIPQTRTYGNNFIYLVMIYFIGAYIKKYNVKILKENKSRIICIMIVVLAIIIYIVAMECISRNYVDYFSGIQSPVILILSIFILNIFKSFKMKNNIYINKIAGATLGIYLIHENVFLRYFIWRTLISGNKYIESPWFVIYSILAILFIFIICCIAHLFIEKILINNIYVLIEKIYHKICKKDIFIKIRKNINNFICEKEGTK